MEAISRGDLAGAVALYEKDAVLVAQPAGAIARGTAEVRAALAGFVAMNAKLEKTAERVVEAGDIALYIGRWSMRGTWPDGTPVEMGGESADILRRQADGRWLIALDNPWGAQIL
jgi:ketosteroid isomerase-like protein